MTSGTPHNRGAIVLIASVELEVDPVRRRLHHMRPETVGRKPAWSGVLAGRPVLLLQGGMGKTNAAQALTAALEANPAAGVIGFGVAGAYEGAEIPVGGVALADAEIYGDEGVEGPGGWISTAEIGIPLIAGAGGEIFNHLPLPTDRTDAASNALTECGLAHRVGPFVTVSACSGTAARGAVLRERFGAIAESMEGAAYVHVAALYDTPCVEIRGISNLVEDRRLERWRLEEAAAVAARAVEHVAAGW